MASPDISISGGSSLPLIFKTDPDNKENRKTIPSSQPAAKRRKLNAPHSVPASNDSEDDHILLYSLDVDVTRVAEANGLASNHEFSERSSEVMVKSLTRLESGSYCCDYRTGDGISQRLDLVAPIHHRSLGLLQLALDHQRVNRNKPCRSKFAIIQLSDNTCQLRLEIFWRNAQSLAEASSSKENDVLAFLLGNEVHQTADAWSPRDFYESVHVPDKSNKDAESLIIDGLESTLFPYQRRTVQWMLNREGVNIRGESCPLDDTVRQGDNGFFATVDHHKAPIFVNPWLGLVTQSRSLPKDPAMRVRGGILAEEMGLGKTVQCLATILQHRRPSSELHIATDSGNHQGPLKAKATLIIAPESIIAQWHSEVSMHAPSLRTFIYPGVSTGIKEAKGRSEKEILDQILDSDIVLASYNKIAREIHYAEDPPDRSLRHKKQYERKRSPLVQIEWWRCILDECQMVESGVSNAAKVANQIPRVLAWAVSGTPLRKDSGDLWGLLVFLRLAPYCWSLKLWNRLLDYHKPVFKRLCGTITLRHTKDLVKEDIQLPPQKRIVVTVPFTQIEEQHYSNMFEIMCNRVGLDNDGGPLHGEWDPNDSSVVETMRSWLTQLRQICLHPQVGERNRRALGQHEQGALRTIEEVLEVMSTQNDTELRNQERAYLICHLRRGQLLENAQRSSDALAVWQEGLPKIQRAVKNSRITLEKVDSTSSEKLSDAAKTAQLGPLRNRLRLILEIEHMATFFIANAYFQIKSDETITPADSERFKELEKIESETYDTAKVLRREILTESQTAAENLINTIKSRLKEVTRVPQLPDFDMPGGIETRGLIDRIDELCYDLNKQATKLDEWRSTLADLLSRPLVDREEHDVQGDEYEISMKQQDEVYVYMDCFRALVADRKDVMTGQENTLIKLETAELFQRAKQNEGHLPKLMIEMLSIRDGLKPSKHLGSLRNLLAELRSRKAAFRAREEAGSSRARAELGMVNEALQRLQSQYQTQQKSVAELEREVNIFSDTQNARLDYYRQLQHISDSVAPSEKEYSEANYAFLESSERKILAQIEKLESRARYLVHLKNASDAETERRCIICQEEKYEQGVLTSCGHTFCSSCINQWLRQSSRCPTCKKFLKRRDFHQITYKPQDLQVEEEDAESVGSAANSSPSAGRKFSTAQSSIYSQISSKKLNEIKSISLSESFSTKVDIIARHILWLRAFEPGAKTVLFSQYQSFCPTHLAYAFRRLKIRFAVVGDRGGVERFKHDPTVECLLMHAGSQASGLNLVNATHVLLCEPLVNTAIELQAIARVHRIGQHRPTTVWMYLVEGTVEKAIYDLSVRRRLAHIGKDQGSKASRKGKGRADVHDGADVTEDKVEAVDAEELQNNPLARVLKKGSEGGEIVGKEDLWTCLFGYKQVPRASAMPALEGVADGDADVRGEEGDEAEEED